MWIALQKINPLFLRFIFLMKKYFENSNFSGTKGNWNSGEPQGEPEVNFYAELKKQEENPV
jgi:hypothetical protein